MKLFRIVTALITAALNIAFAVALYRKLIAKDDYLDIDIGEV